jgi:drug/metabolite transporter (DMT)-like permease
MLLTEKNTVQRQSLRRGVLLALAATVFWALGSVLTKHSLTNFPPLTLLSIELGASTCLLLAAVAATSRAHPSVRAMARLSLPGLLQPGLAYALSFVGLQWMNSVSIETLVWSAEGVLMLPFSVVFLREKVSAATVALGCVALSGIGLVTLSTAGLAGDAPLRSLVGTGLVIAAIFAACWYTVLAQRDLRRNDPLILTSLHHLSGFILALAVGAIFGHQEGGQPTLSVAAFGEAVIAGVCLFGAPFCLYLRALQLIGSSKAAQFLPIVPVLSVIMAVIFLKETLDPIQVAGSTITIAAVAVMAVMTAREGSPPG